jgi:HTH-type transcriptional regulator/antitoxin MqsA
MIVCDICGSRSAQAVRRPFDATYNQIPIHLDEIEMIECSSCGEQVFTPDQARRVSIRTRAAAREKLSLLPAAKILAIRRRYKLSQRQLENILGLGPKTVVRWENDTVLQAASADTLLRVMEEFPAVVNWLRDTRGETAHAVPATQSATQRAKRARRRPAARPSAASHA